MKYVVLLVALIMGSSIASQPVTQTLSINSIEKRLEVLEKDKSELLKNQREQELSARSAEIKSLKARLTSARGNEQEFLNKKLSLLAQDFQVLNEIEQVRLQIQTLMDEEGKLLAEYRTDPEFEKLKIPVKSSYTFEEFIEVGRRLNAIKDRLTLSEKSRVAANEDISKRKKARAALEEEYQEKVREQNEFVGNEGKEGFSRSQQGELIDLQKQLLNDKKYLADLRVKEAEARVVLLDTQTLISRFQIASLKDEFDRVKRSLYVDAAYVTKVEAELDKKRAEAAQDIERLTNEIRLLMNHKDETRRKVAEASERSPLSATDLMAIRDWEKTPTNVPEWNALCIIGRFAVEEAVIDIEKEYKEARIDLDKARIKKEEIDLSIIKSWHSLTRRRLGFSARALTDQIKLYSSPKTEIQSDLALLGEKRQRAIGTLQSLNALFERVKKLSSDLKSNKIEFKDNGGVFDMCAQKMHEAEEAIRRRMFITAKLVEVYSTAIAMLEESIKRIENVVIELGTKSFWRRSELSITWPELKHFFPDIKRFFEDVASGFTTYIKSLSGARALKWFEHYRHPSSIFLLLLRILIIFLVYWILRMYLPELQAYLSERRGYFLRFSLRLLCVVILDFLNRHLFSLYVWSILYILISFEVIGNVYLTLLFHLASIPYMLHIARSFFKHLMESNEDLQHVLISSTYKERFLKIVPPLVYFSIVVFFLRQAFLLGNYHASAVPAILKAINFIVLQFALMGLISKDWILNIIPHKTPLGEWLYEKVDRYYYAFWVGLVAIIIMSNPYVGYGRQVFYVLSRSAILLVLVPLLIYLYNKIRHASADLFFYYTEGEAVAERFPTARTWYGLFVVLAFCSFILVGILVAANILGYSLSLADILSWFKWEIYSPGFDDLGRRLSVTPASVLSILLFVFGGMMVAYVINRVLLRRIFDPLLVSSGVQNTIFTITRYTIVLIAFLIGLKSASLESFVVKLGVVLAAIGFAVKDPILDFFSYFIILVQRPIKIGDFIAFDEETRGVVRHITPRSVMLRRKNSVTIIVPNSQFIIRPVTNWNYSRTFFALNDIMLTVPFSTDPSEIRSIILKVLGENINILKSPAPLVLLHDFVDNGYQFLVRGFCTADKVLEQWEINSNIRIEIVRQLREIGIEVACPTRILKMVQVEEKEKNPEF